MAAKKDKAKENEDSEVFLAAGAAGDPEHPEVRHTPSQPGLIVPGQVVPDTQPENQDDEKTKDKK